MLQSLKHMTGYSLQAQDGAIGQCHDFLFDDEDWAIRYMVTDTAKWLPGRKVLISPAALGKADRQANLFVIKLTTSQIENSPALDEHAPVSREYEKQYNEFYGYGLYWAGAELWGAHTNPIGMLEPVTTPEVDIDNLDAKEGHLRSLKEITGYHIAATDHEIGHVDDLIVDDNNWAIRYMVIDTRNWLPGRKVLVAPEWLQSVSWVKEQIAVSLDADTIKHSPEFDPDTQINEAYEATLNDYYGKQPQRSD